MAMMSNLEIEDTAAAIGSQLSAGLDLQSICERMQQLQPKYARTWEVAAMNLGRGQPLSQQLAGVWPEGLIAAVRAGETSGSLELVFEKIEETMKITQEIQKVFLKMLFPFGMIGVALLIFCGFLFFVIPAMITALTGGSTNGLSPMAAFAIKYAPVFKANLPYLAIGMFVGSSLATAWLKDVENFNKVLLLMTKIFPTMKEGVLELFYGLWCAYLGMLYKAGGLTLPSMIDYAKNILPAELQGPSKLLAQELAHKSQAEVVDTKKMSPDDPRHELPYYIQVAFKIGNSTGRLDAALEKTTPTLLKSGFRKIEKTFKIINYIAIAIAMLCLASPMGLYMSELGRSFSKGLS